MAASPPPRRPGVARLRPHPPRHHGADEESHARVVDALTEAYEGCLDADGHVVLDGTVIVVTARRP